MEGLEARDGSRTRLTSRDTVFRVNDPPNKYHVTIREMMNMAFDVGTGMSDRREAST